MQTGPSIWVCIWENIFPLATMFNAVFVHIMYMYVIYFKHFYYLFLMLLCMFSVCTIAIYIALWLLTLKAPITTAADDNSKKKSIIFQRK